MKAESLFNNKVRVGWQFLSFMCSSAFPVLFWEETWLTGCRQQQRGSVRQRSLCFGPKLHPCGFTWMLCPSLPLWEDGGATRSLAAPPAALPPHTWSECAFLGRGVVLLLYVPLHKGFWQHLSWAPSGL